MAESSWDIGLAMRLHDTRNSRGITLNELAARTGLDITTINRIEHVRTRATVQTAVRLFEALHVNPAEFYPDVDDLSSEFFLGQAKIILDLNQVVTTTDVEKFIDFVREQPYAARELLSSLLNTVAAWRFKLDEWRVMPPPVRPEQIDLFLSSSPLLQAELRYPPNIRPQTILELYRHGGVLTPTDVEAAITAVEGDLSRNLSEHWRNVMRRLVSGTVARVKFGDVMTLDELLESGGAVVATFWMAYKMSDEGLQEHAEVQNAPIQRSADAEQDTRVASFFIKICRWLQISYLQDVPWLTEVRRAIGVAEA